MRTLAAKLKHLGAIANTSDLLLVTRPALQHGHRRGQHEERRGAGDQRRPRQLGGLAVIGGVGLAAGLGLYYKGRAEAGLLAEAEASILREAGKRKEGLPEYSTEEVGAHDSVEKRIWVIFKSGVYDITDFYAGGRHPGADKLLMAAGESPCIPCHLWHNGTGLTQCSECELALDRFLIKF